VKCKKNLRQFLEKKSAEKSHFAEFLKLWPCRKSTF